MASFTIGGYRFDVIDHERTIAGGVVRERFVVDAFVEGKPLDWHPNQKGAEDFPGLRNRQVFEWVGRESVDVYRNDGTEEEPVMVKVGTKRGADFRARFWPTLMYCAEKARVAAVGRKPISKVRDEELTKATYQSPVDLSARSLDAAAAALAGSKAGDDRN